MTPLKKCVGMSEQGCGADCNAVKSRKRMWQARNNEWLPYPSLFSAKKRENYSFFHMDKNSNG
jgi:hypothetical protein